VYVAETLTPRITEIDALTGAHHVVEWTPGDVPSSEEAIRAAREAVVGAGLSEDQLAWMLSGFDALRGDEAVSVFWDFLVDGDDFFWIRDYDPRVHAAAVGGLAGPGPGGTWTVIDRDGRPVTTVELPEDFEPRAIEADHLIGVRRDPLDVESVRVYRIERAGH
jgi:hypothetical protein